MGFRSAQSIIRTGVGGYVKGEYQDGMSEPITIYGSVQPVSGQELMVLPEGLRTRETVKIYTDTELNTAEFNQRPDRLEWRGKVYEIAMKAPYQSGVINHFKYYATKEQVPNDPA